MNYMGNSIVGDDKYKKRFKKIKNINPKLEKKIINLNRHFLHAKTIGFIHPETKENISFDSNIPDDIVKVIDKWEL